MKNGEKPFSFPASLTVQGFHRTAIIRFESGKATHVETKTRRMWHYEDLPGELDRDPSEAIPNS